MCVPVSCTKLPLSLFCSVPSSLTQKLGKQGPKAAGHLLLLLLENVFLSFPRKESNF